MLRRAAPRAPSSRIILLVVFSMILSGCTGDTTVPDAGPLSLQEADSWARTIVQKEAPNAHLVGFVGHEGPAPGFMQGLMAQYVVDRDASGDDARGDGRTQAWALLYGTPDGVLLRAVVRDAPRGLDVQTVEGAPRDLVTQLWAWNLGGRLVVDSTSVVRALAEADERIAAHLATHPQGDVVYASTVAAVEGPGTEDMLYEVYFSEPGGATDGYTYYGQVHHYTGQVVATGDPMTAPRLTRVTLVEESFTLGPVPRELWVEEELPRRVEDVRLYLNTTGAGLYKMELRQDNQTVVGGAEGRLVNEPMRHEEQLGALAPGRYTLYIETTGRITYDLRIDGKIGI